MKPSQFAPGAGHSSRAADIKRSADELRNALLFREHAARSYHAPTLAPCLPSPAAAPAVNEGGAFCDRGPLAQRGRRSAHCRPPSPIVRLETSIAQTMEQALDALERELNRKQKKRERAA